MISANPVSRIPLTRRVAAAYGNSAVQGRPGVLSRVPLPSRRQSSGPAGRRPARFHGKRGRRGSQLQARTLRLLHRQLFRRPWYAEQLEQLWVRGARIMFQ